MNEKQSSMVQHKVGSGRDPSDQSGLISPSPNFEELQGVGNPLLKVIKLTSGRGGDLTSNPTLFPIAKRGL